MIRFDDVALRRGPRVLFSGADFTLFRGEKVGITGENGSGKSSLLAMVRGELTPDAGHVGLPPGLEIAHVAQDVEASAQPAIDFVMDGDAALRLLEGRIVAAEAKEGDGARLAELHAQYAAAGGYDARSRAARLLHGLGFATEDAMRPVDAFSGGWRVRLAVARALMCRSDLLLLDEPTNHLDLDAILWLEQWLREYPGTLLLIAHDREFLDRVVNRIVNLEQGTATLYRGGYSDFETQRAARLTEQSALFTKQQREIRHMEAFVERFRAQATKARQAQSRLKALERMTRIAPAHVDSPFEFRFSEPSRLPRPLLAIEAQATGYGDRPLLSQVDLTIYPGDRIALLGRNGAGKSTLVKLLAGALPALAGTRTDARDLAIGYFAQHQLEQLDPRDSPLTSLRRVDAAISRGALEQEQRDFLAGFGFRGDRVFEAIGPFSGGEKARLALALVAYRRPNLLLLDEPTNHLDLEMRQALAMALQDYAGAVVLVSHDRHLLRTTSDRFLLVHDGGVHSFDGDLDDYARWLSESGSAPEADTAPAPADGAAESAAERKARRREEAERRARRAPLRAAVERAEAAVARLGTEAATLDAQLADPALYAEGRKADLLALTTRRGALTRDIERAEAEWLAASDALETASD